MARGISGRVLGDRYISDTSNHWIDFVKYTVYPTDRETYESESEMRSAAAEIARDHNCTIIWENSSGRMRAMLIAEFVNNQGKTELRGKFIKRNPGRSPDGLWTSIQGYSLVGNVDQAEFYPIKPDDLLGEESYTLDELVDTLKKNIARRFKHSSNTSNSDLGEYLIQLIDQARTGQFKPLPGADKYRALLEKTAGEYLGVISLLSGTTDDSDKTIQQIKQYYGVSDLSTLRIFFPADKTYPLIDSILYGKDTTIQVSSKIHKAGGAASSLSGLVKRLTPKLERKYRTESRVLKHLGLGSIVEGPIAAARELNIITARDETAVNKIIETNNWTTMSEKLQGIVNHFLAETSNPRYQIRFHVLAALVNAVIETANTPRMNELGVALLSDSGYIQVITQGNKSSDGYNQSYYVKDPSNQSGTFLLRNKGYWAMNANTRVGFKFYGDNNG